MTSSRMLDGKVAVVAGANGAIAAATVRALARDGATVVAMARRREAAEAVRAQVQAEFPYAEVIAHAGDTATEAGVRGAMEAAFALTERLDIVVPTVGHVGMRKLLDYDFERFCADFEINIYPSVLAVREAARLMKATGGSIVCLSSSAAVLPFDMLSAYAAAKAGLEQFVRVAAEELAEHRIRVNAVRPGFTISKTTEPMANHPEMYARTMATIPLGVPGEPADHAEAIRFLAGPESKWITGQSFAVDGGNELRCAPHVADLLGVS